VDVEELGVDYLTIAGHKFYGTRYGALYVRNYGKPDGCPLRPLLSGGGQERGIRPGTENIPMIAGLAKAADLVTQNLDRYHGIMKETRDYFENRLLEEFGPVSIPFFFPSTPFFSCSALLLFFGNASRKGSILMEDAMGKMIGSPTRATFRS